MMKEKHAFIYVNADSKIGSGHFWRCLSMADELRQSDTRIWFLFSSISPVLLKVLKQNNYSYYEMSNILPDYFIQIIVDKSNNKDSSLLVIDSDNTLFYEKNFQLGIIDSGIRLMIISVNPDFHYYSHILLNQNIIACYQTYKTEKYTCKLLGPEYFIFSKEFRKLGIQPVKDAGKNIFISFGSADPCHYTFHLLRAVLKAESLSKFNFHVVVGALNHDYEKIKELSELHADRMTLYYNINNVSQVMLQCGLAICSPGLMYWELALVGIRAVLFSSSSREKPIANFFHEKRFAYSFHHYDEVLDTAKFALFVNFLLNFSDRHFNNFSLLRKKLNPEGVIKLGNKINNLLGN